MAIAIIRSNEMKPAYTDGFAMIEMLPGTYDGLQNYKCFLKAGHDVRPQRHADKVAIYCFTRGKGYVVTDQWARNITELAFFVPDFDRGEFTIHAVEDMEFLCLLSDMTPDAMRAYEDTHTKLPYFKLVSECDEYVQSCKGPNTRSWSVLSKKNVGRVIMGVVHAIGEGTIEKGHPSVAQWNYALPGSDFHLTIDGEKTTQVDGDWSYVPAGPDHSLVADPGKLVHYIWYEHFVDPFTDDD